MMHVEPRAEPTPPGFDFDGRVRQPGLSALAELAGQPPTLTRPGPKIAKQADRIEDLKPATLRKYDYWTRALEALHEAYGGICAYACFYIEPMCGPTVDHFVAIVNTSRHLAYEWSNYRLACSLMNSRKREFTNVLDPFHIENGWFVLNLGTFKAEPAEGLPTEVKKRVENTITRLGLDSREYQNMNSRYFSLYWRPPDPTRPIPLWFLEKHAPFLARELRRQGRVRPEDRTP